MAEDILQPLDESQQSETSVDSQTALSPTTAPSAAPTTIDFKTLGQMSDQQLNNTAGPDPEYPPRKAPSFKDLGAQADATLQTYDQYFNSSFLYKPKVYAQNDIRKYDEGFYPLIDNDDKYAQDRQGFFSNLGRGVGRFGIGAVAKTGQSVGFIGSLASNAVMDAVQLKWDGTDIINKAADNGFTKIFSGMEDKLKNEWIPTYQETADRDKGFWYRATHDGDFWMDDVVDGLAFMASAWVPGIALSKLNLGTRIAKAFSPLRVGVSAAEASIEGAGEAANYLSKANTLFKTSLDKYTAWGLATVSESMFEAVGMRDNVYKSLTYDAAGALRLDPETGLPYTEEKKKRISGENARNGFILNSVLLGGTNLIELGWLGSMVGGAKKGVVKGISGGIALGEDITAEAISSQTNFFSKLVNGKVGAFVGGAAKGIGAEGFAEENGQLAIQRINEAYGAKGKISSVFNVGELLNQYGYQTKEAIAGRDTEAATSIGIGGILGLAGGRAAMQDRKRDKAMTDVAVNVFNNANQSFLKFGDIYKTEEFSYKNREGVETRATKIVFDKDNNPVLDDQKVMGIISGYHSVNSALDESTKMDDSFKYDALRDTAWADLVASHIYAGIEDTIDGKLDSIRNASPSDIAKLGFSLNDNIDEQIGRYKQLTAAIISQNKILNSDVLVKDEMGKTPSVDAKTDTARKNYLTTIAAQQAVYKNLANERLSEAQQIKNRLLETTNTSLSDGMVDQLNEIQYRINSQKEVIASMEKNGTKPLSIQTAKQILTELEEDQKELLKNNELTVKELKKDSNTGLYQYEKDQRNEPGFQEQYNKKVKLLGEIKNHARTLGLEWAKFADTKNGRENFLKFLKEELIAPIVEEQKKAFAPTEPAAEKPEEKKKAITKLTVEFENEAGEDDEFEFETGKTYKVTNEDGSVDYYNDITISEDGNTISYNLNFEGLVESDAAELAKFAKESGWEPFVRGGKAGKKGAVVKAKTEHPEELDSDTAIEEDPDAPTYSSDGKKPKFEEVGFNKTFGKHYLDPEDTTLNTGQGTDRFFAFTSKFDAGNGEYVLKVVTANNDEFGIRQEDVNEDDIKIIVMKKTKTGRRDITYNYVDVNNNIIEDAEANKDNIIYRSLSDIKNAIPDSIRKTYSVDESTPDDLIQEQIDLHTEWQEGLKDRTKEADVYLDIKANSPGIQRVERTSAIGKNGQPMIAMATVEGRVVEENPDWSELRSANNPENHITLRVNTRDGALAPGLLAGRAIMQEFYYDENGKPVFTNKTTRVFNRLLDNEEKETVTEALARLSELMGRTKKNPLTLEEKNEYTLVLDYLKGVLNWGSPKEGVNNNKSVWIESGLHINGEVYEFTRDTIMDNKDAILDGVYHNVNNKMLWKKESFQDISFKNDKAVPKGDPYLTYEEYLLASRENDTVPPVYTSLPKIDSEKPQRTNSYLTWRDPAQAEMKPIGAVERTYKTPKKEKNPVNKNSKKGKAKETKKGSPAIDRVIDEFLSYKLKNINIYGVEIEHVKKGKSFYIGFYDPKTGKKFLSNPYSSVRELIAGRYGLKALISKVTNYRSSGTTTTASRTTTRTSAKKSNGAMGQITLAETEDLIAAGEASSTIRTDSYHQKFYTEDGLYETESGAFVNVEYKGKIKLKNGRIWGKDINMSKNEFANAEGFESWDAYEESATKWAAKNFVEGQPVHYYEVSMSDEVPEPATKRSGKSATSWDDIDKGAAPGGFKKQGASKKAAPAKTKGRKVVSWDDIDAASTKDGYSKPGEPGKKGTTKAPITSTPTSIEELRAKAKAKREAAGNRTPGSLISKDIPEGIFVDMETAIANAVQTGTTLTGVLHNFNPKTGEAQVASQATVNIPNGNITAGRALLKRVLQSKMDVEDEEVKYRMPIEQMEEKEDFKKLSAFMSSKLPQFAVKRMANMIHGKALGAFYKGGVYIYENAGYGTGFHEAFEAVWASYLTAEERQSLAEEFRNKQGSFTNPFSRETKAYRDASMYDVREMLAEGFSEVVKDDLENQTVSGKIGEFFKNMWNSIKEFFGLNKKDKTELYKNINSVYKAIGKGQFRNLTPIRELNTLAPAYKQVGALSQSETAEVLDGLNYYFFTELYTRGNNINSILGNLSKIESNALLSEIFDSSYDKVASSLSLYPNVQTQLDVHKQDLYTIFKSNLERYGVQFKELEEEEDNITDTLGIRDSVTIDPRKSTNANIRLLLASIPESKYNAAGKRVIVKSEDLKQPKLVNGDKLHLILLNELSNIVPIVMKNGERKNVINQMFEKLDTKYKNDDETYRKDYAWIQSLKSRLKYEEADGTLIDASELSKEDMQLRVAFLKSFNNLKMSPEKTIVGEDGYIYNFNPLGELNTERIRANWSNNIKVQIQNKSTGIVTMDPSGVMVIDRSTEAYSQLVGYLNFKSSINLEDSLDILDQLGIQFSATEEELESYSSNLRTNVIQILELIRNNEINSINELYGNQTIGGRINELLDIESKFSSEDNVLSYLNADGESEYAVGNTSLFSNMVNTLNTVNSIEELIRTCPWLGSMETTDIGQVYPRMNAYQADSELFRPGGLLFDRNGKRRPGKANQVTFHNISGMGLTNEEGTTTANLLFPERVANKIHFLMNNVALTNINSDKSREYGIKFSDKMLVSRDEVSKFVETGTSKVITDKYISQLKAEMAAAVQQKLNPVYIQYYQNGVNTLGHFRDLLSKKIIDKFNAEVLSADPKYVITDEKADVHVDFLNDNMGQITKEINNYLKKEIIKTGDFLKDLDIFEKVPVKGEETFITYAIDNSTVADLLKIKYDLDKKASGDNQVVTYKDEDTGEKITRLAFSEDDIDLLAGIMLINEELLLAEQHKLIYGHPAMYNDLAKRANGATSTKEAFVEDSDVVAWQDKNMARNDGKIRSNEVHQTTKLITFQNQDVVSLFYKDIAEGIYTDMLEAGIPKAEAEKRAGARFNENNELTGYIKNGKKYTGAVGVYMNLDEADAMCWGMPDMIRDMLFSTSKITNQQELQWDYEIAYEKVARSQKDKSDPAYRKYDSEELKKAQELLDKGDPGYIFQVLKPQYFGYADTKTVTHPVFLKHAVQPKFYRHVEGTQFEKLYLAAQADQVDLIGFVSGQKVGAVTTENNEFIPIYNEQGIVNVTNGKKKGYKLPENLPRLSIFSKFYGIQVEISNKAKNSVVRGTQITKLIMVNFFENGKPINAELGELIVEYNNTLRSMIQMGKVQVLKELGLVKTDEGYITQDLTKLIAILRKEAKDRELPDNMIDAINALKNPDGTQQLEYSFDTLINREKIDNILNSIVDSRVISEKMSGKASVQVANTLYESNPRGFMYLKDGIYKTLSAKEVKSLTDEEKASVRMTSSDLKFYRNEKGKVIGMDAYISWPFKEVTPEQLGLKLENGIYKIPENGVPGLPEELLKAIGFRIPTQAPNSIENIVIKGFTPAVNGDMIVVPSEIVGKSGSDFDIDKLNLYLSHYYVDGPNYNSPEFKQFMINDMALRGIPEFVAERLLDGFTVEDFKKINKAAPTEKVKHLKNLTTSIQDLTDTVDDYRETAIIKDSLTNYNKQFKGIKKLIYTEAGTDTKEALQNKFIEITRKLIERPENYAQLVTPNSTATLKGLATEVTKAKVAAGTKMEENEKSPTFLRSFVGSSQTRERYLTAKRMVGIAALHSTFHSMAQVSGIKLNKDFKTNAIHYLMVKEKGQYPELKNTFIKLEHNSRDDQGFFDVGHRTDVVGQMISDLFSEAVSGFVDGAKDPFVFDLNFSLNSAGTWFYLQHLGTPTEQIAYFFNQPIMDEYFKEQSKNRSNFKIINNQNLTKEELFYKVIAPYYNKIHKGDLLKDIAVREALPKPWALMKFKKGIAINNNTINDEFEEFELSKLKKNVDLGKAADPKMQIAILMNYLEYEAQARMLGNYMQGISYDNKKTRTIQENQLQVSKWNRSKNEKFIQNPDAMLENTFIGELKEQKEDLFNMFRGFFITLTPELQKAFEPMYTKLNNPDYVASKDDMVNLLNRYQNFILSYVLHTTSYKNAEGQDETLNQLYKDMFTGKKTLAKALYNYKKDGDPTIADNLVIKELLPMFTDDVSSTNNIKLFKSKMDTFQINNVIEALDNLKGYAINIGDLELSNFVDNLAKFSILQSGMQATNVDFKKILSKNTYSNFVKVILENYSKNPEVDVDNIWKNFHQNNWNNKSIVPKAPSWIKAKDGTFKVKATSSVAINDYVTKSVKKNYIDGKRVDGAMLRKLAKEKRLFEAFDTALFYNTGIVDERNRVTYEMIDKKGNGGKFTEIYLDDTASILPKNNMEKVDPARREAEKNAGWSKVTTLINRKRKAQDKSQEEDLEDTFEERETGFTLSVDKKGKDQGKADLANAFIGFGQAGTSTYTYMKDAQKQSISINDEIEAGPGTIAFASVNGNGVATQEAIEATIAAAKSVIEEGGTVVMDSDFDANRPYNKKGELIVQNALGTPDGKTAKNYNYWGPNPELVSTYDDEYAANDETAKEEKEVDDIIDDKENECKLPF